MEIHITTAGYEKNEIAKALLQYLEANEAELKLEESLIYYEFPIFKDIDDTLRTVSFLIVTPIHGLLIVQCDDRSQRSLSEDKMGRLVDHIEQVESDIFAKLYKIARFRADKRQLIVQINSILFVPDYNNSRVIRDINLINSTQGLKCILQRISQNKLSEDVITEVVSVIEGSRAIPRTSSRIINEDNVSEQVRMIEHMERQINVFDVGQKFAALTQVPGPQRIRGLAGSGKTIVLAMKAALIHLREPHAKILYTFYTKSLYDYVRRLITRFYRMHEDHDVNWDNLHVRHAWGGKSLPGVYSEVCHAHGIEPLTFREASMINPEKPFDAVCERIVEQIHGQSIQMYDYVLLDEGQDFSAPFYWLVRAIVNNDQIVWAYDELQNVFNVEIQETKQLFANSYGDSGIDLAILQKEYPRVSNDIVLRRCYRNPLQILVIAHAIGFGIYNDNILQMLENKDHWADLGYKIIQGECRQGDDMVINRPLENSPLFLSSNVKTNEIIEMYGADSLEDEVTWVTKRVSEDISQGLLPEDIVIITLDDRYARAYFSEVTDHLSSKGIAANNLLTSYATEEFIIPGAVTLSTAYRAKGNEGYIVYVIGADVFANNKNNIIMRNKIFTSFTRTKGWLRISGIGDNIRILFDEIETAIKHLPNLVFKYPDIKEIKILRRELTKESEIRNSKLIKMQESIEKMGISLEEAKAMIDLLEEGQKK